jgi:hypothetical protein
MRKIAAFLILTAILAVSAGCGLKQSLNLANNELSWRQYFGGMKTEVSLGCGINNSFDDGSSLANGIYHSWETGSDAVDVSLGLGFYYGLFKNDIFNLSAGLKYRNYFRGVYSYDYSFVNYSIVRHYSYMETLVIDYFSSNRVSVIFPDVEIKCPLSDNLKFTFNVELLYVAWRYNGGKINYSFWQDVATNTTYTQGGNPGSVEAPGAVNDVKGGSDIFSIGGINVGILYYF